MWLRFRSLSLGRLGTGALAAGVTEDLAGLGRLTMREAYQHQWDDRLKSLCGWRDERRRMIKLALRSPETAEKRWQRLLDTDGYRGDYDPENRPVDIPPLNMKIFPTPRSKRPPTWRRVVEARGVKLKKQGQDYVGLCPFHDDKTPSFRVTPAKGLFHCPGCGAAGNVIQFVAKKEGIDRTQAAIKLACQHTPGVKSARHGGRRRAAQARAARR